ncbi:peptidylprolyl isomerase [Oceanispirochaeta sp.]|jgi:FKBP-type peptidyl-prolyl cis-trans isomerase SlyD|uniref:FKBP-type peptidyl-prolyl cis-trans isomerase n=1 Tax=Oceanispirochaeta sp. TaxID=2035350 RepID=UPI00262C1627|nr:peptidylprolyl isomerase [Oceanispirochaeta sp.]MDA3955122.1 peptidylprolyl isomerase [Oceanispirochaeta sp.]
MSLKVANKLVVTIHYKLSDDEGNLLDSTEGDETLAYIHGTDSLVPGLEKVLNDKSIGDSLKVRVDAADAYGDILPDLVEEVDRKELAELEPIEVGMEFESEDEEGELTLVEIKKIEKDKVTIDANHPLAGMNLNFEVDIVDIRKATKEELSHGHVHEGGHHHH